MIPERLQSDLCDAWRASGRRTFCYLSELFETALLSHDIDLAKDANFLLALHFERINLELTQCASN